MSMGRSLHWANLKLSDWINIVLLVIGLLGLGIAIKSLFVAVSQLQQATKDGEEQRQSLDASRKQLEAVVQSLTNQQEVLTKNLETSRSVLALQKEQQEVLTKSLEVSKALLVLQKEERQRVQELANRKPRLQLLVDGNVWDKDKLDRTVVLGKDNSGILEIGFINSGNAALEKPVFIANALKKEILVWMTRLDYDHPNRSQVSGPAVPDILPKGIFSPTVDLTVPLSISDFDLAFHVTGSGLDNPFSPVIHVLVQRN